MVVKMNPMIGLQSAEGRSIFACTKQNLEGNMAALALDYNDDDMVE